MSENNVFALVRESSKYHGQGDDTPFPVTLNDNPMQLADGYYISGGIGGNYRPEDLDFYTKEDDGFKLVKRKSWVA
jgi:hypothetical protein